MIIEGRSNSLIDKNNAMTKKKKTKRHTILYKTQHRKSNTKHTNPTKNWGGSLTFFHIYAILNLHRSVFICLIIVFVINDFKNILLFLE